MYFMVISILQTVDIVIIKSSFLILLNSCKLVVKLIVVNIIWKLDGLKTRRSLFD